MKRKIFTLALVATLAAGCKKDFLTRLPQDQLTDDTFWTSETNVRAFAYRFYADYFPGFGSGYTYFNYFFLGQRLNDDFSPSTPVAFAQQVPVSAGAWSFTKVRDANLMISRVSGMENLAPETKNHWLGIGRFFRAIAYANLVNNFGDVPYFDRPLDVTDEKSFSNPGIAALPSWIRYWRTWSLPRQMYVR